MALAALLASGASAGCSRAGATTPPEELAGTITWSLTRAVEDPITREATESTTTTVTMDVILRVSRSRAGVTLFQAREGTWTAAGTGAAKEQAGACIIDRDTSVDLRGTFAANNVVTMIHTDSAGRGLLNFSLSKGDGSVTARTRYCDGSEVAQNRTYFWAISDAAVDVVAHRAKDGALEFLVAKEQVAPCGANATCTRTASGVLWPLRQSS